jgi:hypothetical protein
MAGLIDIQVPETILFALAMGFIVVCIRRYFAWVIRGITGGPA